MPCSYMKLPGGGIAIVKHAAPRRKKCACGAPAPLLCDWKVDKDKTCDKAICGECALEVGPDKHLCPAHQQAYEEWRRAK